LHDPASSDRKVGLELESREPQDVTRLACGCLAIPGYGTGSRAKLACWGQVWNCESWGSGLLDPQDSQFQT